MTHVMENDIEPGLHSQHCLTITQLDYMRLRSWLLEFVRECEGTAGACEEMSKQESDADLARAFTSRARFYRDEAANAVRIMDGLSSRWKPGREPGSVMRDRLREAAIAKAKGE